MWRKHSYTLADGRKVYDRYGGNKDRSCVWFCGNIPLLEQVIAYLAFESRTAMLVIKPPDTKMAEWAIMTDRAALDAANRRFHMYPDKKEMRAHYDAALEHGEISKRDHWILTR